MQYRIFYTDALGNRHYYIGQGWPSDNKVWSVNIADAHPYVGEAHAIHAREWISANTWGPVIQHEAIP